jgi:hypothetical protein
MDNERRGEQSLPSGAGEQCWWPAPLDSKRDDDDDGEVTAEVGELKLERSREDWDVDYRAVEIRKTRTSAVPGPWGPTAWAWESGRLWNVMPGVMQWRTGSAVETRERPCGRLAESARPISVLNCPVKLVIKVLAFRLQGLLRKLIDEDQTSFVHLRCIANNFIYALDWFNVASLGKRKL